MNIGSLKASISFVQMGSRALDEFMSAVVDRRFVGIFRSLKPVRVIIVCRRIFEKCWLIIIIFLGNFY